MKWAKCFFTTNTLLLIFLVIAINGQEPRVDRICATSRFENQCSQLQRGNSPVNCIRVKDSIECALKLRNGTADFGLFTAESALQLATLDWDNMAVIKELRHRDRFNSRNDFESVVIVRVNHTEGLQGLRGTDFCHPGYHYDKTNRWSERFLKHFERTVAPPNCDSAVGLSAAEIETAALADFFRTTCRPGAWSNNPSEDAKLKAKYPQLCALCGDPSGCRYLSSVSATAGPVIPSSHELALNCLVDNGQVAYVSSENARTFFTTNSGRADEFAYLCPNGTKQSISNNQSPCTWLTQPWNLIIASNTRAIDLRYKIASWTSEIPPGGASNWETAIREILQRDSFYVRDVEIQSPRDFFRLYREVPVGLSLCSTQSTWCTTSLDEREKCEVVRAGALSTGIFPIIECLEPQSNVVTCINEISAKRADFMAIDTNFGYLARHPLNLTAALFGETDSEKYSSVVVLIKANSTYERFENFKHAKACLPEFSGIAAMSFINTGKNRGFFDKSECKYARLLGEFFGTSCMPGARDPQHDRNQDNPESLCSLCQTMVTVGPPPTIDLAPIVPQDSDLRLAQPPPPPSPAEGADDIGDFFPRASDDEVADVTTTETPQDEQLDLSPRTEIRINCNADATNRFYGNRGALLCLHEVGDVAIVELQYLKEHAGALGLNPQDYRIMCRNGTLATQTGFDVDAECPLTTIVDNEVLVRRNSHKADGITNALLSLDIYFQIDPDFQMYNSYNEITDLLFKDSTVGLIPPDAQDLAVSVENYVKLFNDLEICVSGNGSTITTSSSFRIQSINYIMTFIVLIFTMFRLRV